MTSVMFLSGAPFKSAVHLKQKKPEPFLVQALIMVGAAGFEPAASTSRTWRDTRLRYAPTLICKTFGKSGRREKPARPFNLFIPLEEPHVPQRRSWRIGARATPRL